MRVGNGAAGKPSCGWFYVKNINCLSGGEDLLCCMSEKSFYLDYPSLVETLKKRILEPAPGRIQLICGPRQVGKTTALLEIKKVWASQTIYISMDGPETLLPGFWEQLWARTEQVAKESGKAVLLLDEIQHYADWSSRLKSDWDRITRIQSPIQIVASGSSSLQLGEGSKESLAGRFERLTLTHWNAKSLAQAFQLTDEEAVDHYVTQGSYPGSFSLREDPVRWQAYVHDAIIESAMDDIVNLTSARRRSPLRQFFTLAAMTPGEIVTVEKLAGHVQHSGAIATIRHYLDLMEHAFLMGASYQFVESQNPRRDTPPKIVVLNQAICAALDPRGVPTKEIDPQRFESWVKNACLAFLWNSGLQVFYWAEEGIEIDAIVVEDSHKWAIVIKTSSYSSLDLQGLTEFKRLHPDFRPIVLCEKEDTHLATNIGLKSMPWRQFLINGLPKGGLERA